MSPLHSRFYGAKKFTPDAEHLIRLIDEQNVGGLVLGWPLNMDGTAGPRCDSVRDFAHAFLRLHDIAISFQDERMSTQAVERNMIAADMTRARRAVRRDSLAAVWILQSALDSLQSQPPAKDIWTGVRKPSIEQVR